MKQRIKPMKRLILLVLCVSLCFLCAAASADNYTVEEDGSKWYDDGHIEWPDGTVTWSVDHDQGQSHAEDDNNSATIENEDGSITVVTGDEDSAVGYTQNEDGSIEIESGLGGVDIEDTPREPLTGEAWQAALNSVAARNGKNTPTVWADPATGQPVSVEVVYMGIGRSMIVVNGEKKLVNTADLRWQTEAPEDQVLAVITSRYAWMHKSPSNKITVLKFKQLYKDTVVRVLATGSNWTFIDHEGDRAYVKTSSLEFYANDHTDIEGGYLSLNGKIKGKGIVQVRDMETLSILDSFQPGTPVTVFDILDDFAEIDVEGWHCVVNISCLTLERALAGAH